MAAPPAVNPQAFLPPPPPTLPPWAKVLYWIVETIAIGVTFKQYDFGAPINPTQAATTDEDAQTWRRFAFLWENTATQDAADDQVFTIDIVNVTDGTVDGTWTDQDYTAVFGLLDTLAASIAANTTSWLHGIRISAYTMAFRPYSDAKPFAESGAPENVHTMLHPGALASTVAPQASSTVTEMTPNRAHWGRMYLPTLGVGAYDANGRVSTATVNAIATAVQTCYESLHAYQFYPVVPVTQVNKQPTRALQTVSGIRVDDLPDIHRTRRYKHAVLKVTKPLASELEGEQQPADE